LARRVLRHATWRELEEGFKLSEAVALRNGTLVDRVQPCCAETIDEPDLKAPHPRMAERALALAPLAEIAPDLRSPTRKSRDCSRS
jgi:hypothetical protein